MATNKTTKQLLEQEYKKELRRINRLIKKGEKQGFYWSESIIPKQPKKITEASIRKLKKITPDSLHKKSYQIDLDTGELVKTTSIKTNTKPKSKKVTDLVESSVPKTPNSSKKKNTEKTAKKNSGATDAPPIEPTEGWYYPKQSTIIFYNTIRNIEHFTPSERWSETLKQQKHSDTTILKRMLYWSVSNQGEQETARRLEQAGADRIDYLVDKIMYDSKSERVGVAMSEMAEILKGAPLTSQESQEIAELAEADEWWESPT